MSRTDYMDVEPALLVFYGALTIAITLSRTSSRPELPLMVGLVMLPIPWLVSTDEATVRAILAFCSIYYYLRLSEVCFDNRYFSSQHAIWRYAHCYMSFHDVRKRTNSNKSRFDLSSMYAAVFGILCCAGCVMVLRHSEHIMATLPACGIFACASLSVFGHLLQACHAPFGIELPDLMRAPWSADSLADFWGKRWNTVIQSHLATYIYYPLRQQRHHRLGCMFATFLVSGVVHAYPYAAGGGTVQGAWSIMAYFTIQAGLVVLETAMGEWQAVVGNSKWLRRVCTMAAVVLPSPLITFPFRDLH